MTAGLLPNGMQQFIDGNGEPFAGGKVYFYVPNTSPPEFKDTWADAQQAATNPNPVILDADGRWTIWGVGTYRQVLTDSDDNEIWDKIVTSPAGDDADNVYDYAVYMEGKPVANELFPVLAIRRNLSLPVNLTDALSYNIDSGSLPTAAMVVTLLKNTLSIGTLTINPDGTLDRAFPAQIFFSKDTDSFGIRWPLVQDLTGANISLTFTFSIRV